MVDPAALRVLFRVAAGPRPDYSYIVRGLSLARAMGVRPLFSIPGGDHLRHTALALGGDVLGEPTVRGIRQVRPDVVVIDDPEAQHVRKWSDAAREAGAVVVVAHEVGAGRPRPRLLIERRRAARPAWGRVTPAGVLFEVLDAIAQPAGELTSRSRVSARTVAEAIAAADARATIRVNGADFLPMAEPVAMSAVAGARKASLPMSSRGPGRATRPAGSLAAQPPAGDGAAEARIVAMLDNVRYQARSAGVAGAMGPELGRVATVLTFASRAARP